MAYLCYTTDLYTAHRDHIKSIDKSKDIVIGKIILYLPRKLLDLILKFRSKTL